jgi:hypothetical protein
MTTSNYKLYRILGINVIEQKIPNKITQKFLEYSESLDEYIKLFDKLFPVNYSTAIEKSIDINNFNITNITNSIDFQNKTYKYAQNNLNILLSVLKNLNYEYYHNRYGKKALPVLLIGDIYLDYTLENKFDYNKHNGVLDWVLLQFKPSITTKYFFWKQKTLSLIYYQIQGEFNTNLFEKILLDKNIITI